MRGFTPDLRPYDGLWIASDKVLGKLFWSNGWVSFESYLVELNLVILPKMSVMSRGICIPKSVLSTPPSVSMAAFRQVKGSDFTPTN
jgi:hypothetical protein